MKPEQIKARLILRGRKQAEIARTLRVSEAAVSQAIAGKNRSARIEDAVAQAIGEPRNKVFNYGRAA